VFLNVVSKAIFRVVSHLGPSELCRSDDLVGLEDPGSVGWKIRYGSILVRVIRKLMLE
jgi:hypothetical protein